MSGLAPCGGVMHCPLRPSLALRKNIRACAQEPPAFPLRCGEHVTGIARPKEVLQYRLIHLLEVRFFFFNSFSTVVTHT